MNNPGEFTCTDNDGYAMIFAYSVPWQDSPILITASPDDRTASVEVRLSERHRETFGISWAEFLAAVKLTDAEVQDRFQEGI